MCFVFVLFIINICVLDILDIELTLKLKYFISFLRFVLHNCNENQKVPHKRYPTDNTAEYVAPKLYD